MPILNNNHKSMNGGVHLLVVYIIVHGVVLLSIHLTRAVYSDKVLLFHDSERALSTRYVRLPLCTSLCSTSCTQSVLLSVH